MFEESVVRQAQVDSEYQVLVKVLLSRCLVKVLIRLFLKNVLGPGPVNGRELQ